MKKLAFLLLAPVLLAGLVACRAKQARSASTSCFRGRLAVKGMCLNYTIQVVGGAIDTALVVPQWRDAQTGKTYQNAFALDEPCALPENLKEGDEFWFRISDSDLEQVCMRCMAYYPVPPKRLRIVVLNSPCGR